MRRFGRPFSGRTFGYFRPTFMPMVFGGWLGYRSFRRFPIFGFIPMGGIISLVIFPIIFFCCCFFIFFLSLFSGTGRY